MYKHDGDLPHVFRCMQGGQASLYGKIALPAGRGTCGIVLAIVDGYAFFGLAPRLATPHASAAVVG